MSNYTPLVSVVIPVLNGANTIRCCLESIFSQSFHEIETIVIDGGSTDGTLPILTEYESVLGYWASEPDKGIYDAMNKGALRAKGKWVLFLGADDQLLSGFSDAVVALLESRTIYYCNVWMPSRKIVYDGKFSNFKLARKNMCHQSIFYPTSIWPTRKYDLRYFVMSDYAFNLECYGEPTLSFQYVPYIVAQFNDEQGKSQISEDELFEKHYPSLVRKNMSLPLYFYATLWHRTLRLFKQIGLYNILWKAKISLLRRNQHFPL